MNAGLSSVTALKAVVLPDGVRSATRYDDALVALGLGVAAQLERHCNRKFARAEAATFTTPGGVMTLCVDRYPIEDITSVQMLPAGADVTTGWETITEDVSNFFPESGVIEMLGIVGTRHDRLRVTFDGGLWFSTLEPEDVGYPESIPDGATALHADLLQAWLTQVQAQIERSDLLRSAAARPDKDGESNKALKDLDLLPVVRAALRPHIRHGV